MGKDKCLWYEIEINAPLREPDGKWLWLCYKCWEGFKLLPEKENKS